MALKVGVLMDPPERINIKKDTTFALLLEAYRRGHRIFYLPQAGLGISNGAAVARSKEIDAVREDEATWYSGKEENSIDLADLDVILARKDPPFDDQYLYDTQILDLAEQQGVLVINRPQALRDANEKLFAQHFPTCCPPTRVSRNLADLRGFVEEVREAVVKPLDGMGGRGIFRTHAADPNLNVILESVTVQGSQLAMVQQYIPEIGLGDKRILLIDGEAVPYALARIPQGNDFRGNIARGGKALGQSLSERDRWICAQVGPELKRRGLILVGLDVIGDYLTEINVTSPTGIRELDAQFGLNIAASFWDCVEKKRR